MCKNCGLRPLERRRRREMLSCLKLTRSVLSSCGLGRQIGWREEGKFSSAWLPVLGIRDFIIPDSKWRRLLKKKNTKGFLWNRIGRSGSWVNPPVRVLKYLGCSYHIFGILQNRNQNLKLLLEGWGGAKRLAKGKAASPPHPDPPDPAHLHPGHENPRLAPPPLLSITLKWWVNSSPHSLQGLSSLMNQGVSLTAWSSNAGKRQRRSKAETQIGGAATLLVILSLESSWVVLAASAMIMTTSFPTLREEKAPWKIVRFCRQQSIVLRETGLSYLELSSFEEVPTVEFQVVTWILLNSQPMATYVVSKNLVAVESNDHLVIIILLFV